MKSPTMTVVGLRSCDIILGDSPYAPRNVWDVEGNNMMPLHKTVELFLRLGGEVVILEPGT